MNIPGPIGTTHHLTIHRFGTPGARPKAYIQAGLHGDEIPGMLVAARLVERLAKETVLGEILVLPACNPLALSQTMLGSSIGRFSFADGQNFNRGYPALRVPPVGDVPALRAALQAELAQRSPVSPAEHLKHSLLGLAIDADIVLDLHCDGEAAMHLYTLTPAEDTGRVLAGYLDAKALLLAEESGDDPFDEACSRPWLDLHRANPAIPLACFACTVELRGTADVSDALADRDADALLTFLRHQGVLAGEALPVPPSCDATPLAGTEPLVAPVPGIVLFNCAPGDRIEAGDHVLDVLDPLTGMRTPVHARSSGVLFARASRRFAQAGGRLGKIAGRELARSGRLLSP